MGLSGHLVTTLVLLFLLPLVHGAPAVSVPALCLFGGSLFDAGNNNNLMTLIKSNFPPYGRDFVTRRPTGRFSNGRLASDFAAEILGLPAYPAPYYSAEASGENLLIGVNFASAASGYFDGTATLYTAVPLSQQLNNYRDFQTKVVNMVGRDRGNTIFSSGIHLLGTGTSDYIQNYYLNPTLYAMYTVDQFSNILIQSFSNFIQNLYMLGARRIGVTNLPPIGCLPVSITRYGGGSNDCVARLNGDATIFNNKLNSTAQILQSQLPGLKLVVFDIYQPLLDLVNKPSDHGFFEARKACCGTGMTEASLLCNAMSPGTCSNATSYVFWDAYHPTEAANNFIATTINSQGLPLIS